MCRRGGEDWREETLCMKAICVCRRGGGTEGERLDWRG